MYWAPGLGNGQGLGDAAGIMHNSHCLAQHDEDNDVDDEDHHHYNDNDNHHRHHDS